MYRKYENKRQTPWDTIDVFEAYCLTPQTFFREIKSRKENKEPNIWTELNRKVIFFTLISIHIKYLLIFEIFLPNPTSNCVEIVCSGAKLIRTFLL